MIRGSLARRYARALMGIGQDKGNYELLGRELGQVAGLVRDDETFRLVLGAPIVNKDAREKVIQAVADAAGFDKTTIHFLSLLNQKGRLGQLEQISEAYQEMMDEVAGRVRAEVLVASPLSPEAEGRLKSALASLTGKEVIMEVAVDGELIGGVVARVAGKLFDGSVKTQLKLIRERLTEAG